MLESTYATIVDNEAVREAVRNTNGTSGEEIGESLKIAGTYGSDLWNIIIKKPLFENLYSIKSGESITNFLSLK